LTPGACPAPAADSPLPVAVAVSGVEHSYGSTPSLRGVSFTARRGQAIAVTGPSGCGKSTLLHVCAGLLRPQSGQVEVFGADLGARDEAALARMRRRTLGIVLQYGQLVPDMSLLDNVALPLVLEGRKRVHAEETASLWLSRVGLADVQTAIPGQVSGGQAQRAAIARALVTTPMVVFADEPLASLDSHGADEMLQLLLDHVRDYRTTLVFVTHDNTVVARADREIRLRDGVVEYQVDLE
jgi:putative ABC transport system ATP-binding protein